jgi:hypothetical protein
VCVWGGVTIRSGRAVSALADRGPRADGAVEAREPVVGAV